METKGKLSRLMRLVENGELSEEDYRFAAERILDGRNVDISDLIGRGRTDAEATRLYELLQLDEDDLELVEDPEEDELEIVDLTEVVMPPSESTGQVDLTLVSPKTGPDKTVVDLAPKPPRHANTSPALPRDAFDTAYDMRRFATRPDEEEGPAPDEEKTTVREAAKYITEPGLPAVKREVSVVHELDFDQLEVVGDDELEDAGPSPPVGTELDDAEIEEDWGFMPTAVREEPDAPARPVPVDPLERVRVAPHRRLSTGNLRPRPDRKPSWDYPAVDADADEEDIPEDSRGLPIIEPAPILLREPKKEPKRARRSDDDAVAAQSGESTLEAPSALTMPSVRLQTTPRDTEVVSGGQAEPSGIIVSEELQDPQRLRVKTGQETAVVIPMRSATANAETGLWSMMADRAPQIGFAVGAIVLLIVVLTILL